MNYKGGSKVHPDYPDVPENPIRNIKEIESGNKTQKVSICVPLHQSILSFSKQVRIQLSENLHKMKQAAKEKLAKHKRKSDRRVHFAGRWFAIAQQHFLLHDRVDRAGMYHSFTSSLYVSRCLAALKNVNWGRRSGWCKRPDVDWWGSGYFLFSILK